jgi:glutamine synthetase
VAPQIPTTPTILTIPELKAHAEAGTVDTVIIAITDMQGRLQGKRCSIRYFLEEVVPHAAEACNYLLAVDVEMSTVDGYEMSSWDRGYGDFVMRPDMSTLRLVPWQPGTAMVLCDLEWEDGRPVDASPRQILKKQLARLTERGLVAHVGTELEFIVFQDSYEEAWQLGYDNLTPANLYNVDYSITGTSRVEHLLRRIRNDMTGAGMYVESAKGECNLGQHEIAFRFAEALTTCDNHSIYKTGSKEIAQQEGMSLSFMAKWNEKEGNSCHIHISFRTTDGDPVMAAAPDESPDKGGSPDKDHGLSQLMRHFIAGQLACARELTYFFAPNINSYKRYVPGSFAPTAVAWGRDNRTCALRIVGHGPSLRLESRIPGGDVNPYLATAALIAAGLHGIDNELPLEPEFVGNAYESDCPRVPSTLREAARLLQESKVALDAFERPVIDHYLNAARVELEAFDSAVTDWERFRGFERL